VLPPEASPAPSRSQAALDALARNVPPEVMHGLRILLSQSADPERAVLSLDSFATAHPAEFQQLIYTPFGLQALVAVFSASRFLTEAVGQHPDWLFGLLKSANLHRVKSSAEYREQLEEWLGGETGAPPPRRLAEYRRRRILRVLLRDVMGFGALSEITEELSNIADSILETSYRRLRADLERRFGAPRLDGGRACGFSVVALGKLGARELNYSSDIDLLFLYEGQGRTDGAASISNAEFFKKLSNQYTELLGTYTAEGLGYRVDLRLRPDGRLGEVCISEEGARDYYTRRARDWELQMLIKARVAAGEPEPGRAFLEWVQPMIYSSTLDFGTVEQMSATRERLTEKLNARRRPAGIDVKLSRGGIRDIEFLVQCLQRLHGGRESWLRNSTTLLALTRLRDKDILSDREYSHLATAYQFLRHLEHRLQFDEDRQTHALPGQPEDLAMVARRMPAGLLGGSATADALLAAFNRHCERVGEIYERIVHAQQPLYYTPSPVPPEMPAGGLASAPLLAEPAASNLVRMLDQKAPKLAAAVARARLARCRTTLEHFLETAIRKPEWLTALDSDAVLAGYLLDLFEHSPFLAEQLVRAPELFEELRGLRAEGHAGAPVQSLFAVLDDASEIRRFFRRQMFRILAESICLQAPIFRTLESCTELADAAIDASYRLAVEQVSASLAPARAGYHPSQQMLVIALGRLGMKEFDLGSDADLVFVIPDDDLPEIQFWTRAAEKLVEILSSYTRDGVMFAVDTRLRPNGRSGLLVQPESAVRDYFAQKAEAWEGISYMKARAVAGDLARGTQFLAELQKVDWRRYGQSGRSRKELRLMRLRLEKELGSDNPLKTSAGGYYDIDFALLYLRLKGAGMFFKALNTPERVEVIEQMGHLEPADARFLRDAATFYRAIDHGLRLISGHAEGSLPKAEGPLQLLKELVARWVEEHLVDQPLPVELQQIQTRTREFFDRLFEA
jgi:glutamate-ammonia-ligase adenylyltransferase